MADRIEWFEFTIPANTPQSAPVSNPMKFLQGTVLEIDIKVPTGPAGNLGFYITAGGSQYIPRTFGSFIFPDGDYIAWQIQNAINSGSWGLVAFNTDVWPHLIQVSFQVNEIVESPTPAFGIPIGV
jgi:hypothetical protein